MRNKFGAVDVGS